MNTVEIKSVFGIKIDDNIAKKLIDPYIKHKICRLYIEKGLNFHSIPYDVYDFLKKDDEQYSLIWDETHVDKIDKSIYNLELLFGISDSVIHRLYENLLIPQISSFEHNVVGIKINEVKGGISDDIDKIIGKKIVEIPTTKPYMAGIYKKSKQYYIHNVEHLFYQTDYDNIPFEDKKILLSSYRSKDDLIISIKNVYQKYNTFYKDYPQVIGENWHYGNTNWIKLDCLLSCIDDILGTSLNNYNNYKYLLIKNKISD